MKLFENYFKNIDVSSNGENGLKQYENNYCNTGHYYDLVITDIEMPTMNGIEMSKAIYKINKNQKIIIISAYSDKKYLIELINMGVEGFIQKPISFEHVSMCLQDICNSLEGSSIVNITDKYKYNKLSQELFEDSEKISLTSNEQRFIEYFMNNNNSSSTSNDIFSYVFYDEPLKNYTVDTIKSIIKRVRKKTSNDFILSDRTTGYSLNID